MISIEETLSQYPKENLTNRTTPLEHLEHLSKKLNFDLFVKRDDLTDLALGGDKPLKLEYEIARVRGQGVDILVTCGSSQSNHARLTTAAARKLGMECAVVLSRDKWQAVQGNLLTVYLMGAQVKVVDVEDHWDLEKHALDLCESLKSRGYHPHYIPVSGTTPHACLGCVRASLQILEQLAAKHDFQIWWSDCLDFCGEANVVRARRGELGVFFGCINSVRDARSIATYLDSGEINENLSGRRIG